MVGGHGGLKARFHTSLGQRPRFAAHDKQSPERARQLRPPVDSLRSPLAGQPCGCLSRFASAQGFVFLRPDTQGDALGWLVGAPLVLRAGPTPVFLPFKSKLRGERRSFGGEKCHLQRK